jgi:hypothetical protein
MDLTRSQRRKTNKKQQVVLPCKPAAAVSSKASTPMAFGRDYACMAMHFSHKQEPRAYGTESKFHVYGVPIKLNCSSRKKLIKTKQQKKKLQLTNQK